MPRARAAPNACSRNTNPQPRERSGGEGSWQKRPSKSRPEGSLPPAAEGSGGVRAFPAPSPRPRPLLSPGGAASQAPRPAPPAGSAPRDGHSPPRRRRRRRRRLRRSRRHRLSATAGREGKHRPARFLRDPDGPGPRPPPRVRLPPTDPSPRRHRLLPARDRPTHGAPRPAGPRSPPPAPPSEPRDPLRGRGPPPHPQRHAPPPAPCAARHRRRRHPGRWSLHRGPRRSPFAPPPRAYWPPAHRPRPLRAPLRRGPRGPQPIAARKPVGPAHHLHRPPLRAVDWQRDLSRPPTVRAQIGRAPPRGDASWRWRRERHVGSGAWFGFPLPLGLGHVPARGGVPRAAATCHVGRARWRLPRTVGREGRAAPLRSPSRRRGLGGVSPPLCCRCRPGGLAAELREAGPRLPGPVARAA